MALVAPARTTGGGGAARPWGNGAPGMPMPGTPRARDLARQIRDDNRGRFTERIFTMEDSGFVAPGTESPASPGIKVTSNRSSFVRLVACRGVLNDAINAAGARVPIIPADAANLRVSLQINGSEFAMTTGTAEGFISYASMFSDSAAPWFWYAAPPRLRVGDVITAAWENTWNLSIGTASSLNASLDLRMVDDRWWEALYGT